MEILFHQKHRTIMKNSLTTLLMLVPTLLFGQSVDFGKAERYVIYTGTGAIANIGASVLIGNIGTNNGTISGFPASNSASAIHLADSNTLDALTDLMTAYTELKAIPATNTTHTPAFGLGETITPGVYALAAAGSLAGNVILDAQNDPQATFIFTFGGAFAMAAVSMVTLTNGALAENVYWVSDGAISMGASSDVIGTFVSHNAAVSMAVGSKLVGRIYSTTGAICVDQVNANNTGFYVPASALPISLINFTSSCSNETTILSWATASEINNDYFTIAGSPDGENWTEIARTDGAGNSTNKVEYEIAIPISTKRMNYYHLKQTDFNGDFTKSKIISHVKCAEKKEKLLVYPNPAKENLNLRFSGETKEVISIDVFNVFGEAVYHKNSYLSTISLSGLKNGVYNLAIQTNANTIITKFVIAN
jgi:hypothetical protein